MRRPLLMLTLAGSLGAIALGQVAAKQNAPGAKTPAADRTVEQIIQSLTEVALQDPEDAIARMKLGVMLEELGAYRQAQHWLGEAQAIDPALFDEMMSASGDPVPEGGIAGTYPVAGPDVLVGDIPNFQRWGSANGITAYSFGTTSCNAGDTNLSWIASTNKHPVISQHMYRLKDGRMEMIGQAWLKHGFAALTGNICQAQFGYGCSPPGTFSLLGVGCSDPYGAGLNGNWPDMGPKHEVNATTGAFPYPPITTSPNDSVIAKRLQVHNSDLNPALNSGAIYFVEGHYIASDDAAAGNALNNASYRRVAVIESSPGVYNLSPVFATVRELPAIYAWKALDAQVQIEVIDVPGPGLGSGRFHVAYRVTDNGDGTWHYEYAFHNFNSDRSAWNFSLPIPDGVNVTNVGFHDVEWHSGAPYSSDDWDVDQSGGAITWSAEDWSTNQNANALRWGTTYNFRFDADAPPTAGEGSFGLFKPPHGDFPLAMSFDALVPEEPIEPCAGPADLDCSGAVNVFDLLELLASWGDCDDCGACPADLDANCAVNVFDLLELLASWG